MSFQLTIFSTLRQEYPTWASLSKALLEKHIRIIPATDEYVILRYSKEATDLSDDVCRTFRSVVWNTLTNSPVCVAPIKALSGPPPVNQDLLVTNFVDGVMINIWCEKEGEIEIASRSSFRAGTTFYSKKSFAVLFQEALGRDPKGFFADILKPGEFVSCTFTHPEHRTVRQHEFPAAYVTYFGRVQSDGNVQMTCLPEEWPERLRPFSPVLSPSSPSLQRFESPEQIQTLLANTSTDATWQGIMFQDAHTSSRWRLRNPSYTLLRDLRGPESDPRRRFLRLRATGKVKDYLSFFREESKVFWSFESALRQATKALNQAYTDVHKLKTKSFQDLPFALRPHVYALHGEYITTTFPVHFDKVIEFVNKLGADQQLQLLSLKVR
jgi:hypothetical protein